MGRRDAAPLSLMRWGLIPSWAKDPAVDASMINARSETAHTLPVFREAMKLRLIPADAFYEWARTGRGKQLYCFEVNDGELFAFAGLWDRGREVRTKQARQLIGLISSAGRHSL